MEAYADHSRRREEFVYRAPVGSLIPGLLFQLTLRGTFGNFRDSFVPDQPRRQLQAMALQRHAILLDQDHMAPIRRLLDREDHRGMDAARARHIFPRPLLLYGDVTAFPPRFDGGVGGGAGHGQISISRSDRKSTRL